MELENGMEIMERYFVMLGNFWGEEMNRVENLRLETPKL